MTTLSAPRALADGVSRRTLTIGPHTIDTPVVLAPMAGITNMAFRLLCREFGALHSHDDGGLYVSEMVTTRALVEDHRESWRLVTMGESESPRSVQRSEEHTSELQSRGHLVCRLLLEKKKETIKKNSKETSTPLSTSLFISYYHPI